ncbi:MAG: PAS domain S-box protein [Alphaproteobacteria bacterium]|nr:PAS domain S-box protein [Alphaproteobacteria bacterium]
MTVLGDTSLPPGRLGAAPPRRSVVAVLARMWRILGSKGVLWAAAAGLIGVTCCVVALAVTGSSLGPVATRTVHRDMERAIAVDQAYGALMKSLVTLGSGAVSPDVGKRAIANDWRAFSDLLTTHCATPDRSGPDVALTTSVCRTFAREAERIGRELLSLDPPRHRIDPQIAVALLNLGYEINGISNATALSAHGAVRRLAEDYSRSILVLTLTTLGFASAGLVLLFLIARVALQASDASDLLHETVEALPAGVVLYDSRERLILFNSMAADVTPALRRVDAIGRTYADVVRESGRLREAAGLGPQDSWIAEQTARFRSKSSRTMRQTPDGKWIEFYEQATPNGRTVGLRVDITALKAHELELERAHGKFQTLVDSLGDIVFSVDVDGNFAFVSAAAESLVGARPSDLIGTRFRRIVHPDDWARVRDIAISAHKSSDPSVQTIRFRLRRIDGSDRHVEARFQKVLNDSLSHGVLSGAIRDIDESVQLAARLAAETNRLRSIVESSGALIMLLDRDLRISMVNKEFVAISGVAEHDAVGRPLKDVIPCPLDPAVLTRWLDGPLQPEDAEVVHFSNVLTDPNGTRRLINVTAKPIADDEGVVRSIVFLGVDDTVRHQAELRLFDAERMKSIGELAATVAHEVNQPLQVIRMAAEAALEEIDDPAGDVADTAFAREKLDRVVSQVERATRIIGEIRAYARSAQADEVGPIDPMVAVRGTIDLTRHSMATSGIKVELKLPESIPRVSGHIGRLEQVLINLVNNAREALDELPKDHPKRLIQLSVEPVLRKGREWLRLAIEDSGPGIAPNVLPRLFGEIVTTKPRGKGTGLGLPLCRRIIEEMGGTIRAENRADGGARFEILLPVLVNASPPLALTA